MIFYFNYNGMLIEKQNKKYLLLDQFGQYCQIFLSPSERFML